MILNFAKEAKVATEDEKAALDNNERISTQQMIKISTEPKKAVRVKGH